MSKLVRLNKQYYYYNGYGHWCPGCGGGHEIAVGEKNSSGAEWQFNNNLASPSFSPSINIRSGRYADPNYTGGGGRICHYFITDGKIIYCSDTTHALSGKTVDLPDIPENKYQSCQRL
jgi:hypothetical protein